jgi:hypothetical protein
MPLPFFTKCLLSLLALVRCAGGPLNQWHRPTPPNPQPAGTRLHGLKDCPLAGYLTADAAK